MTKVNVNEKTRELFHTFPSVVSHRLDASESEGLKAVLNKYIPKSLMKDDASRSVPYKYVQVLNVMSNNWEQPIYIYGGAARDYVNSGFKATPGLLNDIDVNTNTNEVMLARLKLLPNLAYEYNREKEYLRIGSKDVGEYLEGFSFQTGRYEYWKLESKCNSLSIKINSTHAYAIPLNERSRRSSMSIQEARNKQAVSITELLKEAANKAGMEREIMYKSPPSTPRRGIASSVASSPSTPSRSITRYHSVNGSNSSESGGSTPRIKKEPVRYPANNITSALRVEQEKRMAREKLRQANTEDVMSALLENIEFTLVDLFGGDSFKEAREKIYSAPIPADVGEEGWEKWVSGPQDKLLYRILKFRGRGYTIDDRTAVTVYNYWAKHTEEANRDWAKMWKVLDPNDADKIMEDFRVHLEELSKKGLEVPSFADFVEIFTSKGLLPAAGDVPRIRRMLEFHSNLNSNVDNNKPVINNRLRPREFRPLSPVVENPFSPTSASGSPTF